MTIAIPAGPSRTRLDAGPTHPLARIGIVAGLVLPLVAAILYPTYDYAISPGWLETTRQLGLIYLAGEIALVVHAQRRGFDPRAVWGALPGWARGALALFLVTFWLSSAFVSRHPGFSLALSLGWVVQLLFAGALFHCVRRIPVEEAAGIGQGIARGFVMGLAALAVLIAIHFTIIPSPLRGLERELNWDAAIPGFISARLFGAWCGAVLALLTGMAWMHAGSAREQRPLHLALMLAFGLTFWTTTRAALLAGMCVLPIAWALAGQPRSRAFGTVLPWYLVAGACLTWPLVPYGHPAFLFFDDVAYTSIDTVSSGRITLWATALRVAGQYPLLGSGAGSSWWLVSLNGFYHVQPHNAVVQFLLNWGLLPTIPALALLGGATWHAHRAARATLALLPMVLMLDALLVMAMFDGMLHFAQFVMLIVSCLAICLARHVDMSRNS